MTYPSHEWGTEDIDRWLREQGYERQLANPCPECGAQGACDYDEYGRPLIHVAYQEDA